MVRPLIALIRIYQRLSAWAPPVCRFEPSCSHYMILALEKHGLFRGLWIGACRLSRCHPFHPGGHDPVR